MTPRILTSISAIAPELWNRLAGLAYPFLRHEFLLALESSGSVGPGTGLPPVCR